MKNGEYIPFNLDLDLTYANGDKKWYFLKQNGMSSCHTPSTNISIYSTNCFEHLLYASIFLGTEDATVNKTGMISLSSLNSILGIYPNFIDTK